MRPLFFFCFSVLFIALPCPSAWSQDKPTKPLRGWNTLTFRLGHALEAVKRAPDYQINYLEVSHQIAHDLKDLRNTRRRHNCNTLISQAHQRGIEQVFVWDHAFYDLDYYPDRFKLKKKGRQMLNLDDPAFWAWVKEDYRKLIALAPEMDGVVLTFIETGSYVQHQYSKQMGDSEKMAYLVNQLSELICGELGKKLHIRTFFHKKDEKEIVLKALSLIENKDIKVMVKEVPHDFFHPHPVQDWVEEVPFDVYIEFDVAQEYNGQSTVANTFSQLVHERWKYYLRLENVVGYVARTDRYGTNSMIGTPNEVALYQFTRLTQDTSLSWQAIQQDFISKTYGKEALPLLDSAFNMAMDINMAVFYTLGINSANHSRMDFDYESIYSRYVSGRWLEDQHLWVGHGIGRRFHYWKDVVEHLAPARYKQKESRLDEAEPDLLAKGWLSTEDKLDKQYFDFVVKEKAYGVSKAKEALELVRAAAFYVADQSAYPSLEATFFRTYLMAQLMESGAWCYFGYRLLLNQPALSAELYPEMLEHAKRLERLGHFILDTYMQYPAGQLNYEAEAHQAFKYADYVKEKKWPKYPAIK